MIGFGHMITKGLIAVVLASGAGLGLPAIAEGVTIPPFPLDIQAPEGNTALMEGNASGTQDCICLPSGSGFFWTFVGPQAMLFVTFKLGHGTFRQQIITHFPGPNPLKNGMPQRGPRGKPGSG